LLAVVEEASGVEDYVFDAIDSLGYERLVCIGNPIRAEGKFVDLIRQADRDRADNVPPRLAVNAIRIPSTESPHAHQEKSEFGLADRTWIDSMYRKYGKGSLWVRSHVEARIPDVAAEQLIDPKWLHHHSSQQRPPVPPTHPVNSTRRISCDLSEGVGRDSTCIMVLDDWGVLEVVMSNDAGLPEAAATIHRLVSKWQVAHDWITYDKLRTEAGWKLHNRLDTRHPVYAPPTPAGGPPGIPPRAILQRGFYFCPGDYYVRLVEELRPLTYSLVGRKTKLMPKDEWAAILGRSPDVADALIQSMILTS